MVSSSEDSDSETESSVGPFLRCYINNIPDVPVPIQPVEDSPVTVRQSGRVRRKHVCMGENYQMLHSVPASSGSMWNQRVNLAQGILSLLLGE